MTSHAVGNQVEVLVRTQGKTVFVLLANFTGVGSAEAVQFDPFIGK